jgi:formylmethanofuran dehydrogenase subunit E
MWREIEMSCQISPELIEETIRFHGHWCPGLAIGVRAAEWALAEMGKAGNEEIVAVVETDMCGVDAVQYLTGCTFGKGNLIYRDYGKNAFSFYRRRDGKAVRLVVRAGIHGDAQQNLGRMHAKMQKEGLSPQEEVAWRELRAGIARRTMDLDLDALFELKQPDGPVPKRARIFASMVCDDCGEPVMESRTRRFQGRTLCIPCFEKL